MGPLFGTSALFVCSRVFEGISAFLRFLAEGPVRGGGPGGCCCTVHWCSGIEGGASVVRWEPAGVMTETGENDIVAFE